MSEMELWIDPGVLNQTWEKPTREEIDKFQLYSLHDYGVNLNAVIYHDGTNSRTWHFEVYASQYAEETYRLSLALMLDEAVRETASVENLALWLEGEAAALRARWKPEPDSHN